MGRCNLHGACYAYRIQTQVTGRKEGFDMSKYSKLAFFVGGTLFGSVGLKLLSSREAKDAYVRATAVGLRVKDYTMKTVTTVQENAADVLAQAKECNEMRAAKIAAEQAESEIKDEACEAECKD